MRYYLILFTLCSFFTPLFGQDTVIVNINSHDTSYFRSYIQASGLAYKYQDKSDSVFIELGQRWGSMDMGHVTTYPTYEFKSTIPDGLYFLYIDSLLHKIVSFKHNMKVGESISYHYDFRDNEIGWSYKRDTMQFTVKDCRRKRNTFNLVVFVKISMYNNGLEVSNIKSVYTRKRRLCRLTFVKGDYTSVNSLINRALRKKFRMHKKIKQILY